MKHIYIKGDAAVYTDPEYIHPGDYVTVHTIDGDLLCISEDMYPMFDCRGCVLYKQVTVCGCVCKHDTGYSRIIELNKQMEEV